LIRSLLSGVAWALVPLVALLALSFLWHLVGRLAGWSRRVDEETAKRGEKALFGQTIKQAFAAAMEPAVGAFVRLGVHPHALTFLCLTLSVVAAAAIAAEDLLAGGVIAAVASLFDYFDGRIARRTGRASLAGNFLDSTIDRVSELIIFGGIALLFRDSPLLLLMTLIASAGAILTSYARAKAESLGLTLKSGWLQRPERMTLLCLGATFDPLASELGLRVAIFPHPLFGIAVSLLAIFGVVTTLQRLWGGLREADRKAGSAPPA
jgi:CDP-diacylglycerol---glycerol-3-phosphate 3-phosphatidyltransferase